MKTRGEMIVALCDFCDEQTCCRIGEEHCLLDKLSDSEDEEFCDFNKWPDDKLAVAYDIISKNGDARLDGSHLENVELDTAPDEASVVGVEPKNKPDMVNHPQQIVEEMRRLFELFDDDVKIFVNKSNKTVDIQIDI